MTLRRATTQERIDARNDARIEYEQDHCPHDEVETRRSNNRAVGALDIERVCVDCGLDMGPVEQEDDDE